VAFCHAFFAERLKEGPEHAIRQRICGFRSIGYGSIVNASDNWTTLRTIHHGNVVHAPIASNGRIARYRFGVRTTGRHDFALDNRPTVHRTSLEKLEVGNAGQQRGHCSKASAMSRTGVTRWHRRDVDSPLSAIDWSHRPSSIV
jgi:hypothetical protein